MNIEVHVLPLWKEKLGAEKNVFSEYQIFFSYA
jgi:hypothetical protein